MDLSFNAAEDIGWGAAPDVFRAAISRFNFDSSFILSSDQDTLIASGERKALTASPDGGLTAEASALFAGLDPQDRSRLLVGAIPFKHSKPARLFQPEKLERFSGGGDGACKTQKPPRELMSAHARDWQVTAEPSRVEYARNVAQALAVMEQSWPSLRKVVIARSLVLRAENRIDPGRIFERLRADRSVTSFCVPLDTARSKTLVGATPELLLAKSGAAVTSRPLAGSARRSVESGEDRRAADLLLRSEKDLREHISVRDTILDSLAPYCRRLKASDRPFLVSTASMWHLATEIEGELRDDQTSSLELAIVLHPTPAVCGLPKDLAGDIIDDLEPFDRGFFSGAVGWCDERGDGRWLVAIRCAEITENVARLFAGAGIVAGSDPELEAAETSAKFRALLDALGVEEDEKL